MLSRAPGANVKATAIAAKNGDQKAAAEKPRVSRRSCRLSGTPSGALRRAMMNSLERLTTAPNRCRPSRVLRIAPVPVGTRVAASLGTVTSLRKLTAASIEISAALLAKA